MRYEVFYKHHQLDGRAHRVLQTIKRGLRVDVSDLAVVDTYLVNREDLLTLELAAELLSDPVAQFCSASPAADSIDVPDWSYIIEVTSKAGVTDPVALTARDAIESALKGAGLFTIQTARQYVFCFEKISKTDVDDIRGLLHNPLIQNAEVLSREQWDQGDRLPDLYPHTIAPSSLEVSTIQLSGLDTDALEMLSKQRLLALTAKEMEAIQRYYSDSAVKEDRLRAGLPAEATDVELEMIAQTWSEHCKHKILNARVEYTESGNVDIIDSLFSTYIRQTTEDLSEKRDFLRSVFHDDSGVIEFDKDTLVCFKVETHNSPSALDPYGGAITGIVGVNRDILGTGKGARPIFNTNVLCFGEPDTPREDIPAGLLHPVRVMNGVHHGIIDGGNQSGIPVVAGAFLFDESYVGKPLVFCGTGGILPARIDGEGSWIKHIDSGDLAVMVGGRIGKDGIHGATFSSLALDETSPTSAVQIGDPITQKKMGDLLTEARDLQLYKGITDNGAGGLSSSLGEMAELAGGIKIYLDKCPLKYQGLAPWEILVSESQERMSLSISSDTIEEFLELAARRDVEATVVGEFTDTGLIEIFHVEKKVAHLSVEFLHDGLPVMNLQARWTPPTRKEMPVEQFSDQISVDLLRLLREPNIASKEALIRQYDHEVQAQSVIKPFAGSRQDAPSDGAVLRPKPDSNRGLTVTHGVCPRYGDIDTYNMAACAVDEAFRAHIALGGDPETAAALDNFCWPDPVESASAPDGAYKMAQLVRACRGLQDACLAYGLPLISGKDSMKNDAVLEGKKVSVRPTLLVSLMGIIKDLRKAVNTDFHKPGDLIFAAGKTRGELGGSMYEKIHEIEMSGCPVVDFPTALNLYKKLHLAAVEGLLSSCHDISEGGIAVAIAESALGGRVGVSIDIELIPRTNEEMESPRLLFCESPSRFVISIDPLHKDRFLELCSVSDLQQIGMVNETSAFVINRGDTAVLNTDLPAIEEAWKGFVI
ncbi:MAG: phosphoribosylformylglycinamidine synthase [Spirochaetales bacterium]|jgi:phosphoribosylformylglycinamidine synthase subunit PurSL|nr:phosphoribosylformylglycinamidine synthase [Spirochaetales bacterium]